MIRQRRHLNAARVENEVDGIVEALNQIGDHDLAGFVQRCQQVRVGLRVDGQAGAVWGWRCRSPACPSCRLRLGAGWRVRAGKAFQNRPPERCSAAVIGLTPVKDYDDVLDATAGLRIALRNLRDRRGRLYRGWRGVELHGHVGLHLAGHLQPRAVAQINVAHPLLTRHDLAEALDQQWPNRVDVGPLLDPFSIPVEIEDASAEAAWWSWVDGLGDGLRPLRLRVGPAGAEHVRGRPQALRRGHAEPMPTIFSYW